MKVTSLTFQSLLIKANGERFLVKPRMVLQEAPEWVAESKQALDYKEKGLITFDVKKKLTPKEEVAKRARELDLVVGDGTTVGDMETMIKNKLKELEDAKK